MAAAIMKPTVAVLQMRQLKRKLSLRFSEGISVCGFAAGESHPIRNLQKLCTTRVCNCRVLVSRWGFTHGHVGVFF